MINKLTTPESTTGQIQSDKEFSSYELDLIELVSPYTMTSPRRIVAAVDATEYIEKNNIEGSIVECGVWRGGSMMAIAATLKKIGSIDRELYLFDTFEGMTQPDDVDKNWNGVSATELMSMQDKETSNIWAIADYDDVVKNMKSTGYPERKLHFVKGKIEDTLPQEAPDTIALLRLDTDWYESTRHELVTLFPRVVTGGVIIIDDYGYWQGCKKAVDEYIDENNIQALLCRIDFTGRVFIKT